MKPGDLVRINRPTRAWSRLHGKVCLLIEVSPSSVPIPTVSQWWRVLHEGGIIKIPQVWLKVINEAR
jgi:hypothetical protein